LNDKLLVKAFYAYVTGDVTTKTFDDRDTTYNNLLRRPEHSFGINIGYQVAPAFFVSLNYKTFSERKDTFYDNNDYSTSLVSLSAYQLLDCYAEYSFLNGKVKLFADAKNILNQDYMEVYGYSTMRFNINAGLSCKL
jgi:vitamin B12 transporter